MASPRKILTTTSDFDDAVTVHAQDIIAVIKDAVDPDLDYTFYLFQDFSTSQTDDPSKNKIVTSVYNRNILQGFLTTTQRVHFIRSRCYAQMADERTLAYFNLIRFNQ